ncbi:hypothetical protein [Brachyspira hampsonii]|uniref:hypothetical protein n=1 Tax=Brachyspira hampsonii TaxID=1287055 RepID=UPI00034B0CBE|nr:hypothetical protein [Brachyspira hampsonii]
MKKSVEDESVFAVIPSAKKVDEYINNDNSYDLPSLDDLDDIVSSKNKVHKPDAAEEKKYSNKLDNNKNINRNDVIEHQNKENKKDISNKKIDLFSDSAVNYSKDMADIINNLESYSIFEKDKYTSEISSALTKIIEENDERFSSKDTKKQ